MNRKKLVLFIILSLSVSILQAETALPLQKSIATEANVQSFVRFGFSSRAVTDFSVVPESDLMTGSIVLVPVREGSKLKGKLTDDVFLFIQTFGVSTKVTVSITTDSSVTYKASLTDDVNIVHSFSSGSDGKSLQYDSAGTAESYSLGIETEPFDLEGRTEFPSALLTFTVEVTS